MTSTRLPPTKHLRLLVALMVTTVFEVFAQAPQTPVFRSGTAVVTASVTVKRGNKPVTGLKPSDFVLTDNGVAQTVDRVTFEDVPIDVTVVIDLSGSTSGIIDDIRRDTRRILGFLRPIDRVRIVSIDTYVHEPLALQPVQKSLALPQRMTSGGNSSIRDAIAAALITRSDPERRRLVVAITDGDDSKSVVEAATVMDIARHSDTVLHIVFVRPPSMAFGFGAGPGAGGFGGFGAFGGFGGGGMAPGGPPLGPGGAPAAGGGFGGPAASAFVRRRTLVSEWDLLLDATVITGGDFHGAKHGATRASEADAVDVFRRVFDEFRQSYVVQFTPENVPTPGWHELVVKVKGVDDKGIRARKGYFGG